MPTPQRIVMIIGVLLSVHLNFISCVRQDSFPLLEGPYLGQTPPGMTPELFAPGLVSRGFHEHSLTMSPDGKEMFFVMADASYSVYRIIHIRNENDAWSVPQLAPFSSDHHDFGPTFAPDGRRLFFASSRSTTDREELNDLSRIWYVEEVGDSWGSPHYVELPVDSIADVGNPSLSAKGTLFYQYRSADESWDIYSSEFDGSKYGLPQSLGARINTRHNESAPFIAPDESYLLFHSNRPGGYGSMDLYVSYRLKDDSWSVPTNLGNKINSSAADWKPMLSPDGRYLFFSSYRSINPEDVISRSYEELMEVYRSPLNGYGTLFWVDATIVGEAKPRALEL